MNSTKLKKPGLPKRDFLGEFEQIVLLATLRLRDDAYGMTIRQEIQRCTGRDTSVGAVYITRTACWLRDMSQPSRANRQRSGAAGPSGFTESRVTDSKRSDILKRPCTTCL